MNRQRLIASAIGAVALALGIGTAGATDTAETGEIGDAVMVIADTTITCYDTPAGWGHATIYVDGKRVVEIESSTPCAAYGNVIPTDVLTGVVVDGGDGVFTTGPAEAKHCLADGSCVPAALDLMFYQRLADCESGNDPDSPEHGRYRVSGAWQIARSTWVRYGGDEYAPRASQATAAEQLTIARRIHDAEGIKPWGTCGRRAAS